MGLVLVGTVIGLIGMVAALIAGHPAWVAFLMMPACGSGSVMILAATAAIRERPQRSNASHRFRRAL